MPMNPLDALRKLGLTMPPTQTPLTPEEQTAQDVRATQIQSQDSPWKQANRKGFDMALEGLLGAIGVGADTQANRGGQVLGAGLPFAAVGKARFLQRIAGKPVVFHGTPSVFTTFDKSKLQQYDNLGSLISAAEEPAVAASYAEGTPLWGGGRNVVSRKSNIIPITSSSENVLDIAHQIPVGEDWNKIKQALEKIEGGYQSNLTKLTPEEAGRVIRGYGKALRDEGDPREWLNRAKSVLNDPNLLADTGFDAVRYFESGSPTWGFPNPEQLSTPWGTPLGALKRGR
jgi:hypothetical protein